MTRATQTSFLASALAAALCVAAPHAAAQGDASDTDAEPKTYYATDIKAAMQDHIKARVDDDGVFRIRDNKVGEVLELRFVTIHDPVRVIDDNTYFACTDFHVVGDEDKLYDLDFWMNPVDGTLKIYDEKIHKEPRRSLLYGWYKHPRYTFVDDKVVPLD